MQINRHSKNVRLYLTTNVITKTPMKIGERQLNRHKKMNLIHNENEVYDVQRKSAKTAIKSSRRDVVNRTKRT